MAAVDYTPACLYGHQAPVSPAWPYRQTSLSFPFMEHGPAKQSALDEYIARTIPFNGSSVPKEDWSEFVPCELLPINHPWISRYSSSALTHFDNGPRGSNVISTKTHEVYGDDSKPAAFRIGAGTAGYTGILKILCERYIEEKGNKFSIAMVRNTSRHSQVALLADVVQVALTQEPHNEDMAISEGWCERTCRVFNDHFLLTGPVSNPASLEPGLEMTEALQTMVARGCHQIHTRLLFQSNGDGSSTFYKKHQLWTAAGIDVSNARWVKENGMNPHLAIKTAAERGTYLLTDRATYLTAKDAGLIPRMKVYVEGGAALLNPCSALLNNLVDTPASRAAAEFARWLASDEAQELVRSYGKDWSYAKPLFTVAAQDEFAEGARLVGKL